MVSQRLQRFLIGAIWGFSPVRSARGADWTAPNRLRDLWYYPEYSLVFNQVRKAGASSTLVFLAEKLFGPEQQLVSSKTNPWEAYRSTKKQAQARADQMSPALLLKRPRGLANSTWFTVVRQPQIRLLSAFLSQRKSFENLMARAGLGASRESEKLVPGLCEESEVRGFRFFLDYLEGGGLYKDPHWAPQVSLLVLPVPSYDYVVRLENFDAGMERVLNDVLGSGTSLKQPFPWRNENMTWEQTGAGERYQQFFPRQARIQSEGLYRKDFEILRYQPLSS